MVTAKEEYKKSEQPTLEQMREAQDTAQVQARQTRGVFSHANSTRLYGRLLAAGVEIYEYQPTMLHQKFMVCDGLWATVGTTNFDNRSFALNDENNVCVYDRDFAARLEQIFQADLTNCRRVTLEAWRRRGLFTRAPELLAWALRDQV